MSADRISPRPEADTPPEERKPELRGTFASVMLLGVFLVIVWVLVFVIYLNRQ